MTDIVSQNAVPRTDSSDTTSASFEYDPKIQIQFDRVQNLRLKYLESVASEESSHRKLA